MPRAAAGAMLTLALALAAACAATTPPRIVDVGGHLRYERREVRADLTGLGPPVETAAGKGVPFVVRAGARVVGRGVTGDDGAWTARVPAPLPASATVTFQTVVNDRHGRARFAIARAWAEERRSPGVWEWTFPAGKPTAVVRERDGSGALRLYGDLAFTVDFATSVYGRVDAPSLVVLWSPGRAFACFACFEAAGGRGAVVGSRRFESVIWLDGSERLAQAWTDHVVMHELGHWVMAVYSVLPDDSGEHTLVQRIAPQSAWLEGWATFFAQVVLSARRGADQPRVVAVTDDGGYALDLRTGTYIDPAAPADKLALPDPRLGMRQDVAEGFVAAVLWGLRAAVGERVVLRAITSPRLTDQFVDRGAKGRDLVDFLDALVCDGRVALAVVDKIVRGRFHFPYEAPVCGRRAVRAP
jgi:hypothetical protein